MSSVALCVLVRDEEDFLDGCLASARGAVKRMIVVDTGSQDRSREIARAAGAVVIEHAWSDDFAAARNAALAHVREDWILVLDADERLAPGGASALAAAARRGDLDCGLLPLSNADRLTAGVAEVLDGSARRGEPVLLPRFLRRTPDLAWRGVVHENVDAWFARGRRARRVEAPIVHYGQVPELRAARGKDARNLRLLRLRVARDPEDAVARNYLARELERAGDGPAALAESGHAWRALLAARARGVALDATPIATLRAYLLLRARDHDEARAVLDHAQELESDHPNLNLLRAALEESLALAATGAGDGDAALARAELALERCLAREGAVYACELLPGATDWAAATRLGVVRLLRGAPGPARASFERALAVRPGHREAELGRLEARLALEGPAQVLPDLEPQLLEPGADGWILSSLAFLGLGLHGDARTFAREACGRLKTTALVSPHRLGMLKGILKELGG